MAAGPSAEGAPARSDEPADSDEENERIEAQLEEEDEAEAAEAEKARQEADDDEDDWEEAWTANGMGAEGDGAPREEQRAAIETAVRGGDPFDVRPPPALEPQPIQVDAEAAERCAEAFTHAMEEARNANLSKRTGAVKYSIGKFKGAALKLKPINHAYGRDDYDTDSEAQREEARSTSFQASALGERFDQTQVGRIAGRYAPFKQVLEEVTALATTAHPYCKLYDMHGLVQKRREAGADRPHAVWEMHQDVHDAEHGPENSDRYANALEELRTNLTNDNYDVTPEQEAQLQYAISRMVCTITVRCAGGEKPSALLEHVEGQAEPTVHPYDGHGSGYLFNSHGKHASGANENEAPEFKLSFFFVEGPPPAAEGRTRSQTITPLESLSQLERDRLQNIADRIRMEAEMGLATEAAAEQAQATATAAAAAAAGTEDVLFAAYKAPGKAKGKKAKGKRGKR